jgi:hypothetical protein
MATWTSHWLPHSLNADRIFEAQSRAAGCVVVSMARRQIVSFRAEKLLKGSWDANIANLERIQSSSLLVSSLPFELPPLLLF